MSPTLIVKNCYGTVIAESSDDKEIAAAVRAIGQVRTEKKLKKSSEVGDGIATADLTNG
jgi:hypothetical protein